MSWWWGTCEPEAGWSLESFPLANQQRLPAFWSRALEQIIQVHCEHHWTKWGAGQGETLHSSLGDIWTLSSPLNYILQDWTTVSSTSELYLFLSIFLQWLVLFSHLDDPSFQFFHTFLRSLVHCLPFPALNMTTSFLVSSTNSPVTKYAPSDVMSIPLMEPDTDPSNSLIAEPSNTSQYAIYREQTREESSVVRE